MQGVGFRPWVYRLARAFALDGFVRNDARGVAAEVEGPQENIRRFVARLERRPPRLAAVDRIKVRELPPGGPAGFAIVASEARDSPSLSIPGDAATCEACRRELFDPAEIGRFFDTLRERERACLPRTT